MEPMGEIMQTSEIGFNIPISDSRKEKDSGQQLAISERFKKDKVDLALNKTKQFLGKYSSVKLQELSVNLIDGKIGEGQLIRNKDTNSPIIELQLPTGENANTEIDLSLGTLLSNLGRDEKKEKCKEISEALVVSTILHEGVHGLLVSRPDSQFAQDLEAVMEFPNENGKTSTLLDEGIAYAIQGIYAPNIKPLGSLAPVTKDTDEKIVQQRKILGEKLRPIVKDYIDSGISIDDNFFETAKNAIIEVTTSPALATI